jgi:hydroxymethylpyrimidine/phosphomethylpyrimidine kinase
MRDFFSQVLILDKGMLASAETIKVVAECLREWDVKTTVIDPV